MRILSLIFLLVVGIFADEFNLNANDGAVKATTTLKQIDSYDIKLNDTSAITGLDYNDETDEFLISTRKLELYVMDGDLKGIKRYLKSTKDWIIQMEDGVSACFFGDSIGVMSYNKTYAFFKFNPNQSKDEANQAWRYLLKGYENFSLDFKDRYYTVRAKQQYILSWDYSKFYGEFFIATVPDDIKPSWSVASFSDSDNMLSTEFIPSFDESLEVKKDRDLTDYYITAMSAEGEFIYLLSKQYSAILKLDPRIRKITEVYAFSGLSDAHALATKGGKFFIASKENGVNKIVVFEK